MGYKPIKVKFPFSSKKKNCPFQVRQNIINAGNEKKGAFHMPENSGIPIGNTDWEKNQSILSIGAGGSAMRPSS